MTIDLAPIADDYRNHLPVMDGWNDAIRLNRPRREILEGHWTPAVPEPVA